MPRPAKLTEAVLARFCEVFPKVTYINSVAGYIGFSGRAILYWLKRGKEEHERLEKMATPRPKPSEDIYLRLFRSHKRLVAEIEAKFFDKVVKASNKGTWQAAAWILERRFGTHWASDRRLIRDLEKVIDRLEKEIGNGARRKTATPAPSG